MALRLIIDGYNLIRTTALATAESQDGLEAGRTALLEELAAYQRLRRHRLTVVFDGAGPLGPSQSKEKGIKVVFTPAGMSADEQIVRLIEDQGDEALVVTSDQGLARRVEAAGAETISSPQFRQSLLLAAVSDLKGANEADERPSKPARGPARRLPKRQRRRQRKVSKL